MKRCLVTCCVTLLMTSVAVAQNQRPGAAPGGRGLGFGGPGALSSSTALLTIPEVQKELSLNEEQTKKVRELADKVAQDLRPSGNRADFANLTNEERQKRFEELRKKAEEVSKSANEQVAKILDEKQVARLNELRLQRQGVAALSTAEVAKALSLTDEQKEKLSKLQADLRPAGGFTRNAQDQTADERRAAAEKARAAREKATTEILAVLTADQKASWEKMQGKKFDFPAGAGFGGGRPGAAPGGTTPPRRGEAKKAG